MFFFTSIIVILSVAFADDPIRPQYHIMPPQNWINDPNGPFYYNGYYHMFYQYYPSPTPGEQKHWGHCYSKDMVHWIRLPIALSPDHPYDINGIWTGSTTIVDDIPTIIYTGMSNANHQVQCQAQPANLSDPILTNWTKSPLNPLINAPDGRDPATGFRDSEDNYYLIYGYGTQDLGGQAVLFTSKNFLNWTYLHPIHSNHYGNFWECPDIFSLGNYVVLKASSIGHDFWALGTIDPVKLVFTPINHDLGEFSQMIDHGNFYASKSFYDPINKQQVILAFAPEDDNLGEQRGWQNILTLPRAIFLSDNGLEIRTRPIKELQSLRDPNSHRQYQDITLGTEIPFEIIPDIDGNQIEVLINWQFPKNQNLDFGLIVLSTPDGTQQTSIGISTMINTHAMMNWELSGWDYASIPSITHWLDCQSACNQDNKCQSWTYDAGRQMNDNCFLKTGIPLKNANWLAVSGVKQRDSNQQLVWIYVNRVFSQWNPGAAHSPLYGAIWMEPLTSNSQWSLELDIFIDHSIIEVFEPQEGRIAITARVYPEEADAKNLAIYALRVPATTNDSILIKSLDFWKMNTIWT